MNVLKTSTLLNKEPSSISAEMRQLDELGEWCIDVDQDISEIGFWTFFIDENEEDYVNLKEIITTNSNKYVSIDGCLLENNELIFAPKCKRLCLPLSSINTINPRYSLVWNHVCSLNIRTIFEEYLCKKTLRNYLSDVLMVYRENIIKCVFCEIKDHHSININDFPVKSIELSDVIIRKEYKGISRDVPHDRVFERDNDNDTHEINVEKLAGFTQVIYGQYFFEEKKIILYPEAMKTSGETGRNLEDIFLSTLFHEMFHALFHMHNKGNTFPRVADEYITINESLAAAFEKYFLSEILRNNYLADRLTHEWERHSIFIYPYSGALVLSDAFGRPNFHLFERLRSIRKMLETDEHEHKSYHLEHNYHEYEHYKHEGLTPFLEAYYLALSNIELAQSRLFYDYMNRYGC